MTPRTFFVLTFISAAALIGASAVALHGGVATAQTLSPDGSSITPTSGGSLVTSDGTWTFGSPPNSYGDYPILLNGQQVGISVGILLEVAQGKLYEENTGGLWFVYQGNPVFTQTTEPTVSSAGTSTGTSGGTTSCTGTLTNYYQPSITTPSGYGASYDLFSSQHKLEVQVQNCPANSLTLTVGSNQSNQYVYNKGYLYGSGSWQSINLTGTGLVSNAWYPQLATATLSGIVPSSWTYVVGYVCAWSGTIWQCGCANTACTINYWQLQAFQSQSSSSGGTGSGADGQWGGTPDANAIVISPTGSDSNPCTVSSPCQSLEKAQQAVRASSDKTVYLRAGTYDRSQSLTLDSSDNGETWQTYPGDAVDSAVLDGDGAPQDTAGFFISGASDVTINGFTIQNFTGWGVLVHGGTSVNFLPISNPAVPHVDSTVVENNIIKNIITTGANDGIGLYNTGTATNTHVLHNVFDGTDKAATGFAWTDPSETSSAYSGALLDSNVALHTNRTTPDSGGMYFSDEGAGLNTHTMPYSINITVSNNFIRDYQGPAGGSPQRDVGIYLDIGTGNQNITGNIIANTANIVPADQSTQAFFLSGPNINFHGNIVDLGTGANDVQNMAETDYQVYGWVPTTGDFIQGNIYIGNWSGAQNSGFYNHGAYSNGISVSAAPTIQNNMYWNYGGGTMSTTGGFSDASPITNQDPLISGWTYALAAGSPAYSAINFPHIKGGWGPPGFVIPQNGTPPSSPN